jgi:non-ribosomal peptide synthetase component F
MTFEIDSSVTQRLWAFCVKFRIKPFVAVLACYAPLLFASTGERDLIIGTVRANRRRPDTGMMVGHFANLIPLRLRLDPERQLGDWVRDVAAVCTAAHARDELPFLDLAAAAWRQLRLPASRLAEFSINFVPFAGEPVIWDSDLRMAQVWGLFGDKPLATSRVTLFIRQQQSGLGGTLVYDRTTIDPGCAASFAARFAGLVERIAGGSAGTVASALDRLG